VIGCPTVFFFAGRLTGVFLFGLPILDQIESPTAAVILRLYSDNGIDLHWPSSSTARHGCRRRTRGALTCVAADCSRSRGVLRWSVIAVIAKDFTDIVATDFDLHVDVHAMAHPALPSV
jgi:hypothetical protein